LEEDKGEEDEKFNFLNNDFEFNLEDEPFLIDDQPEEENLKEEEKI